MRVEVFDGKRLHLVEHIHTEAFQDTLGHYAAQARIEERTDNARHVNGTHRNQNRQQFLIDGVHAVGYARRNAIVDQSLQKRLCGNAADGGNGDTRQYDDPIRFISGSSSASFPLVCDS